MSPRRRTDPLSPAAKAALTRMAVEAGEAVRSGRTRRRSSIRELSDRAGVAVGVVHAVEAGRPASLETYARLGSALGIRPTLGFTIGRVDRSPGVVASEDFVHAAMAEAEARRLAGPGRSLAIDEPYQHFQFAGRADLLAWDLERRALLHVENRTRFPNIQEAAGSYNAKRQFLARALAARLGLDHRGWVSVTHVMACLWSSEVLHVLRLRTATFAALCPDPPDALESWLSAGSPAPGVTSTLVLFDPLVVRGSRRRAMVGLAAVRTVEPRYRDYAAAAAALRRQSSD